MIAKPKTRSMQFTVDFDAYDILTSIGIVLLVLKVLDYPSIGWGDALAPFVLAWTWRLIFRFWLNRMKARHPVVAARRLADDVEAIGWSVALGLMPGYGHDNNGGSLDEYRQLLRTNWNAIMTKTLESHGFLISAVMTDATVLYPTTSGCPEGGEHVVVLSGSSNPSKVRPDQFDAYVAAVEHAVYVARDIMQQNSVRIEFTRIARSSYFRADGLY